MPFSYDDFRQNADLRTELSQFLHSDVGMILLRVMRQKYRPNDVPVGMDALASARQLSKFDGAHMALDDLENATMPLGLDQNEIPLSYPETDHERMPSPEEMRPRVRIPVPPVDLMPPTPPENENA